jgi:hypothetical protein
VTGRLGSRVPSKDPYRREINHHLWVMHGQSTGRGDKLDRLTYHDELHAQGNEEGYAGYPLHRHEPGSLERMGEVVLHEGEGT